LLILVAAMALAGGRIATVVSREGTTAFLSANDRSRWSTVSALVEDGTFVIDRQHELTDRKGRRSWQSIDRVQHRGPDGKQHNYSSKPPLLPVLVAGVYWVVNLVSGMTLTEQPIYVTRVVLAWVNLPLLLVFYLATLSTTERIGMSDWARRFMCVVICFGTMVLPFAVSLNNHLPAATATAVVLCIYVTMSQKLDDSYSGGTYRSPLKWSVLAGICAAFAAANELPALSMLVLWGGLFYWLDRRSLLGFGLGVLVVAIGFFGTNWVAHGSLRPPYMHRGVGPVVATLDSVDTKSRVAVLTTLCREKSLIGSQARIRVEPSDETHRLRLESTDGWRFSLQSTDSDVPVEEAANWEIRRWDDWYEYPGSYWQGERKGVDRGEKSRLVYLFHSTLGHHGLFSLTPFWILMPWGLWLARKNHDREQRHLFHAISLASVVCFTFYLMRPEIDRNYGGVSVCFRWMLWFAPLWLAASMTVVDRLANNERGRWLGIVLLGASAFSVATSVDSPWQAPWIYRYLEFLGWIGG